MAEFERALIQERVRAGIRNARAKGKRLGRPSKVVATVAMLRSQGTTWRAISSRVKNAFANPAKRFRNAVNAY
jgi:DNA invertase Pin-like site-specific DNA recombinase